MFPRKPLRFHTYFTCCLEKRRDEKVEERVRKDGPKGQQNVKIY
jgi:hypothetical protein